MNQSVDFEWVYFPFLLFFDFFSVAGIFIGSCSTKSTMKVKGIWLCELHHHFLIDFVNTGFVSVCLSMTSLKPRKGVSKYWIVSTLSILDLYHVASNSSFAKELRSCQNLCYHKHFIRFVERVS